jgi:acyl-CoA dehydrogenase
MSVDWPARAKAFAEKHLAPLTGIQEMDALPDAIWQAMAEEGLLALSTPEEFGGTPIDPATQIATVEGFVRAARNVGVGSIWQGHLHNAGFVINRLGNEEQRRQYLPALAKGEVRMAVSISEPKVGAHPKHLTTRAERDGDGWRITGEKSYLTQGPQATMIAVLAITSEDKGVKRYSIFLVPKGAEGLEYVPGGNVDFLKPSSHCGLKLNGVRVGQEAMLGPMGEGYDLLGKPMRDHEDLVNLGSRFGGMAAELDAVKEAVSGDLGAQAAAFGALVAALDGLKALAGIAVEAGPGSARAEQLLLDIRNRARAWQQDYGELVEALGITLPPREASLKRDLDKLGDLAGYVQKIKLERLAAGW